MKLNLFACQDEYLLSPDCMLAPREATKAHWPVSALLGTLEGDDLPGELRRHVEGDIDEKQFSFVSTAEAFRIGLPVLASKNPPNR